MYWNAFFERLRIRFSNSRRKFRRTQIWWPTPAIEALEQRVLPTYVTITQMPTHTVQGVGHVEVETYTDPDNNFASWSQRAQIQLPDGSPVGTYETGRYESTGDLVFKIHADEDDLVGCPVKVTLSFSGRVFWTDDPVGPTGTSTFRTNAGVDSPTEIIELSGGHLSGDPNYGQAYTFSMTGRQKLIETTIGETITVKVHQDGYGEPWYGLNPFGPPNTLQFINTGVIDATLSVAVIDVESMQREIDVDTFDDDLANEDLFGPYLENVSLAVEFDSYLTTELDDERFEITSATWQIGGFSGQLTVTDGELADLVFDPKSLSPGPHKLKIIGYDNEHRPVAVTRKELTLNVIDDLDYQLQVMGKDGDLIDADDARFFQGIQAEVTFVGTIRDLPSHYASFSSSKPSPHIFLDGNEADIYRISEAGDPVYKFEFTYDVSTLPVKDVLVDLKIGTVPISFFHDEAEKILVVKKPTWIVGGTPKYDDDAKEYYWTQSHVGFLKAEAPQVKSGLSLLDKEFAKTKKSKSVVSLDGFLNIKAPIDMSKSPHYEGSKLIGNATLLGKTIWNKVYASNDVAVVGTLNAKTLDPQSFGIRLAQPIVVDQFTLTNPHAIKVNLLKGRLPEWLATFTLGGSMSATTGTISVNGGFLLTKTGDQVRLDPTGTFFGIDNSTLSGTGTVSAEVKVAKGYILEAGVEASLTPEVSVDLIARFSGVLGSLPTVDSVDFKVSFRLKYHAKAFAKSKLTGNGVQWDSGDNGSADDFFGDYNLIDLHL